MNKDKYLNKPAPITQAEKILRQTVIQVTAPYETEYRLHHEGGLFVERVVRHFDHKMKQAIVHKLNADPDAVLEGAISLALYGCTCRINKRLSIPSLVRTQIADEIIRALNAQVQPAAAVITPVTENA